MVRAEGQLAAQLTVLAVLDVVVGCTLTALLGAAHIMALFGVTGVSVVTRVPGIVPAAPAAQYVLGGLRRSALLAAPSS